ncbi:MAG: alpha/beta hydrolase [Thermodesulfobacteriota bacterium]
MPDSKFHYLRSNNFNKDHPTILMIHGAGQTCKTWENQFEILRDQAKFNTVILDLPGHGKSSGPGCSRIDDYKNFLKYFCGKLDLKDLILVGHSMGGGIAQRYTIDYPQHVDSLILVATGARLRVAKETLNLVKNDYDKFCEIAPSRAFADSSPDELKEEFRWGLLSMPPEVVFQDFVACDEFDITGEVEDIGAPTLIISGDQDILTPVKYGEYLNEKIKNSNLQVIRDAGHFMMKEKPYEFNRILMNFLKSRSKLP